MTAPSSARRRRRILAGTAAGALGIALLLHLIGNSDALRQKSSEVAVRGPGERRLGSPGSALKSAGEHLDFAYLSQAAYDDLAGRDTPQAAVVGSGPCPTPGSFLGARKWHRWQTFPNDDLAQRAKKLNLRVQVWENEPRSAVVVTFGGTLLHSWQDWLANLRWFIPWHEDQYTEIVESVGPAFVEALRNRADEPGRAFVRSAKVYTTGHSLGGGLAQQFAYALPADAASLVTASYVFDPSPVTGFYSVPETDRRRNSSGLTIDRAYERGEILAALRLGLGVFYRPSEKDPSISNTRYDLVERNNPFASHSIADLACGLYRLAGPSSSVSRSASE